MKKCSVLLSTVKTIQYDVLRFDSTIVNLSSKLIKNIGFNQSGEQVKSTKVKFTVGYSELPETIKVFGSVKHKSENVALKEAIFSKKIPKNQIILFDRGSSSCTTCSTPVAGIAARS